MTWDWNNYVAYQQFNDQLLEDFCEVLAATDDPNDYFIQHEAARCVGLSLGDLTTNDRDYISKRVSELKSR